MENKPVELTAFGALFRNASIIAQDSNNVVMLVPQNSNKCGSKRGSVSNIYQLWVNNELIKEMRVARAMSFLDGWKLANSYSNHQNSVK